MIIFGTRRVVRQLLVLTTACLVCDRPAAQASRRITTWFPLFFVPVFPVRSQYVLQCVLCGAASPITKDQAQQMQVAGIQPRTATS